MLLDGTAQANTLAHQLPGKLAGGTPLTIPLISYLGGDVLIKKLEQSLPGSGRGKYVGRSFMWVGCRWSRYCSSRGCTENKWTAILGGLITQGSWVRELVCLLSVGWFPLLFGPSEFCSLFSYLEGVQSLWKKTGFLDGTGTVVETDGGHVGIHFLFNIIWEEVSRKGTLAKVTKILLIFCC